MELSRLSLLSNGIDTFPNLPLPIFQTFLQLHLLLSLRLLFPTLSSYPSTNVCLVICCIWLLLPVGISPFKTYAMRLGQFNATPSRTHFLIAKHILHYLAGTRDLALCLGSPSPRISFTLSGYLKNVGCSDADW